MPTEMGSAIYRGWRPRADASVVMLLKQAGATVIGKTTTTAFAANDPTPTLNPHQSWPYAGRLVVGLGGGRGRRDDSAGGRDPDRRLGDPAGLVLRRRRDKTVVQAAAEGRRKMLFVDARHGRAVRCRRRGSALGAVGDHQPARMLLDATARTPRIGGRDAGFAGAPEAASERALRIARVAAERAGASVRGWRCPRSSPRRGASMTRCRNSRRTRPSPGSTATHYDAMPPLLRASSMTAGTSSLPPTTRRAGPRTGRAARWPKSSTMSTCCSTFSAPGAAPKGLASTGDTKFNKLWTLMGVPCVNVPADVADGGLPVGVQVIARFGDDAGALRRGSSSRRWCG